MGSRRCPREGKRVVFDPTPASRMFYRHSRTDRVGPRTGESGTVVSIPIPGGKKTCMPGPRGGMIYVRWDGYGVEGVFADDLKKSAKAKPKKRRSR